MLDDHVSDEGTASPAQQRMPVVFGDVEQASLRGEDRQVDSRLFPRRRMAPEDRIKLHSSAIERDP